MSERKSGDVRDTAPGADESDARNPGVSGLVPDIVRRALLTGVGALFMTEEGIRNAVGEMKLPKDALGFLLKQADTTRTEIARVVTQEMRRFLESETLRREIWKLVTGVTLEVNATIQLKPSGDPGLRVKFKRRKSDKAGEKGHDAPAGERGQGGPHGDEADDE